MCKQSISTVLRAQYYACKKCFLISRTDRSAILCALGAIMIMSYIYLHLSSSQRCSMNKLTLNMANVCTLQVSQQLPCTTFSIVFLIKMYIIKTVVLRAQLGGLRAISTNFHQNSPMSNLVYGKMNCNLYIKGYFWQIS